MGNRSLPVALRPYLRAIEALREGSEIQLRWESAEFESSRPTCQDTPPCRWTFRVAAFSWKHRNLQSLAKSWTVDWNLPPETCHPSGWTLARPGVEPQAESGFARDWNFGT